MLSRGEKKTLALLGAVNFGHIVDFMILMPLGPQLMRIYGINPHEFGLLVSVYNLAAGVTGLLASLMIDRFDRKRALLFILSGFTVGTFICGISSGYEQLLAARALTGAFGGILSSLIFSITGDLIEPARRGHAMGFVMGSFSLASILGVPFSLFLANHWEWRTPFLFLGGLSILVFTLIIRFLPSMRGHLKGPHSEEEKQNPLQILLHILTSRQHLIALSFTFLLVFSQFSVIPFLSPSFVANGGMKEGELPLVYLFGGLVSILAQPWIGRMADRHGKKRVFVVGVCASLLPMAIITNIQPSPLIVLLLISSSFFFVMGARMVPAMALITLVPKPRHRASFMSVNSSVQQLGSSLASFVTGLIVVKDSVGRLVGFPIAGGIAIGVSLLALGMSRRIKVTEN